MAAFRFIVSYEGTIEASHEDEAREWAEQEVEQGCWQITHCEVERIKAPDEHA